MCTDTMGCANAAMADDAGLRRSVKCLVELASLTQDEVFTALKVYEDGSCEYDTLQDRVHWMSRIWAECVDRLLRELAYGEPPECDCGQCVCHDEEVAS